MMRRMLGLVFLLGSGCVHFGESTPTPANTVASVATVPRNLTPDQVTAQNAHAVADSLYDQWAQNGQEIAVAPKKVN